MSYSDAELLAAWTVSGSQRGAAEKLGVSRDLIRGAILRAGKDPSKPPETTTDDERVIESELSPNARSLEDLLRETKVDLEEWEVRDSLVNSYQVAGKNADGEMEVETLYQVKAWLRRRTDKLAAEKFKQEVLDFLAARAKAPKRLKRSALRQDGEPCLYEVAIFDPHFGRLCWADETEGRNYDTSIATRLVLAAVERLLARGASFNVDRFLFPVGNDLLHTDNANNTTTKGTRIESDTRHAKVFRRAWQTMVTAIDILEEIAPVDVIVVPGNHDRESTFKLGEVLYAWYRNSERVNIDNRPTLRKYYSYGKTLLGFTHGVDEKESSLPNLMSLERPQEWADSHGGHREWHLGHLHKKKESRYNAGDVFGGVRLRRLPALCEVDEYHYRNGFVDDFQAAEAFLWGRQSCYMGHFSVMARQLMDEWEEKDAAA